jgi:hypothetical protein
MAATAGAAVIAAIVIVIAIIIIWRHAAARRTKSGFNLENVLVDKYKRQQELNKHMASIKGDKGICTIGPYGKSNAIINCPLTSITPVLPATVPATVPGKATKYTPDLEFTNGEIVSNNNETYLTALGKQIPGTWTAPQHGWPKTQGGCNMPLYEDGYLTAYCATGKDHHGWEHQGPQLSMIKYPAPGIPMGTLVGNQHGHLAAATD